MVKRIAAITFIFLCTTLAWAILGTTIFQRTYDSGSSSDNRVESTWGAPQSQSPPAASFDEQVPKKETRTENGKAIETITQETVTTQLPLDGSHINVDLNLEHRQKGLLWYSTYKVAFDGAYSFHNPSDKDQNVIFKLDFPTAQAIYDDLIFTVNDSPVALTNGKNSASGTVIKTEINQRETMVCSVTRGRAAAAGHPVYSRMGRLIKAQRLPCLSPDRVLRNDQS